MDALKSLYGTARSSEIEDIVQNVTLLGTKLEEPSDSLGSGKSESIGPAFDGMVEYIWDKTLKRKESSNLKHRFVVGNHVLPFAPVTYYEVIYFCDQNKFDNVDIVKNLNIF